MNCPAPRGRVSEQLPLSIPPPGAGFSGRILHAVIFRDLCLTFTALIDNNYYDKLIKTLEGGVLC